MREILNIINGERFNFKAIFNYAGKKSSNRGCPYRLTVLLTNIKFSDNQLSTLSEEIKSKFIEKKVDPTEILTDHIWLNWTKGIEKLELLSGDMVEFNGTITHYIKGYAENKDIDCKITNPRSVIKKKINSKPSQTDENNNKKTSDNITFIEECKRRYRDRIKDRISEKDNKIDPKNKKNKKETTSRKFKDLTNFF